MNTNLVPRENQLSFGMPLEAGSKQLLKMPTGRIDPSLMILRQGRSASEYRAAANHLLHGNTHPPSRIFVTSPRPGDGKTCTAFNLAWALADAGRSVLLVELNFTQPQFRIMLGNLQLRFGLDNALRGAAIPEDSVFSIKPSGIHVAAVKDSTPLDKMASLVEHLDAFLDWSSENYEIVVADCPPVISRAWNTWFHKFIGPAMMVVREGQTPLVEVQRAAKLLGNHLVSVLLNESHAGSPSPAPRMAENQIVSNPQKESCP